MHRLRLFGRIFRETPPARWILIALSVLVVVLPAPGQPPKAPDYTIMRCVLHGNSGQPVTGAQVRCWWILDTYDDPRPVPDVGDTVLSNDSGAVTILARIPPNRQLAFLEIRHPDWGLVLTPWQQIEFQLFHDVSDPENLAADPLPVNEWPVVELPERVTMEGAVVDHDGNPVDGASVSPILPIGAPIGEPDWDGLNAIIPTELSPLFDTKTAADGTFRIEGLPADIRLALRAWHPAAGTAEKGLHWPPVGGPPLRIDPSAGATTLQLPRGGALSGVARQYASDSLPPNCTVRLTPLGNPRMDPWEIPVEAGGHYRVDPIASGHYRIELVEDGLFSDVAFIEILSASALEAPVLTVGPGAVLAGRFVRAGTDDVVEDANVYFELLYHDDRVETITPAITKGTFRFQARPGVVTLRPGGENCDVPPETRDKKLILAHGVAHTDLVIPVVPYKLLTGRVTLPNGEPVRGAAVSLYKRHIATSEANGHFSAFAPARFFEPLPPNTFRSPLVFEARHDGKETTFGFLQLEGELSSSSTLEITVHPAAAITGQLLDSDGAPAAGVLVTVTQPSRDPLRIRTDDTGSFRVAPLYPGRGSQVRVPGLLTLTVERLEPGVIKDLETLQMGEDQ